MSELRWHPLLEEWVVIAGHRQNRPQMPADWCPFCPGSGRVPEAYDVFLFPNDFPAFLRDSDSAYSACDVVLYSSDHTKLPSQLPLNQWQKIVDLWTSRTRELIADARVKYVAVFENAGEAAGVTMPHPHGQIYALPFVPPRVEKETRAAAKSERSECLHCGILEKELAQACRIIARNGSFVAFAPYFARFPYETCIYSARHAPGLADLTSGESAGLAAMILEMRQRYDALFGFPMPLMMALQQTGHFYVEFLPLQRSRDKLKYLASAESSLGIFLNDVPPERAAAALRNLDLR
ncbi:MAG TPA: galactose-1-phosphate uridylyltransferase [Bryobacteraceae bacterium]|nr:galactose-1-phosphate uridylyltransferase [Bryobacteraceae bacterium]